MHFKSPPAIHRREGAPNQDLLEYLRKLRCLVRRWNMSSEDFQGLAGLMGSSAWQRAQQVTPPIAMVPMVIAHGPRAKSLKCREQRYFATETGLAPGIPYLEPFCAAFAAGETRNFASRSRASKVDISLAYIGADQLRS